MYLCICGFLLLFFSSCSPSVPSEQAATRYVEGKRQYQNGDYRAARDIFVSVHHDYPHFFQNSVMLGKSCFFLGETDEAISYLEEVAEKRPEHIDAVKWLCRSYLAAGNPQKAIEYVQKSLALSSEDYELQFLLAKAYRADGHIDKALTAYSRAEASLQRGVELYIETGELYRSLGLWEPSLRQFKKAADFAGPESSLRPALDTIIKTLESGETE